MAEESTTDQNTTRQLFVPLNTDVIDSIPSPEISGHTSDISHQPVRQTTDGQIFQVYRLTNVRYEQSQTATGVAGAVSSGYQSGGIQESGAIFPTYAGMSGLHTTGPVVDLSKCCLCQHRNFRASQKPCGHCVCENCCVGHSFQPCKRCGRIVTEVWAMDPTI